MAAKKKAASPVAPLLLILVSLALLAVGAWLLLSHFDVFSSKDSNKQHEFTMQVGEQKTLEVPFKNAYTCTSSENGVVSYDADSKLLTANTAGKATLVAKDDVTGDSELYLVTVVGTGSAPAAQTTTTEATDTEIAGTTDTTLPPGTVTGITLSYYRAEVKAGELYPYAMVEMQPKDATDKSELWTSSDTAVATVDKNGNITGVAEGEAVIRVTSANNPRVFADINVKVLPAETTTGESTTDGTAASTDANGAVSTDAGAASTEASSSAAAGTTAAGTASAGNSSAGVTSKGFPIEVKNGITYVDGVMIANKTYSLPSTYNPGLDPTMQAAFNEMQAAASRDGRSIAIVSGFRSYDYQDGLYKRYCNGYGKAEADRFSARAGHSEHQTGLAADINNASDAFTNTPEAKWLAENCWKYGFILRYPKGKESVTGYMYESWHVRYLGKDLAKKVYDSGLTLEEYFGITSQYAN